MVWVQPKGRIVVSYSSRILAEGIPHETPVVVGVGIVWIQPEGRSVVGYCSRMLTEGVPRDTPIVVGFGKVWFQPQGRIISIYCCIEVGFIFAMKKIADRKPTLSCTLVVNSFCDIGNGTPFLNSLVSPVLLLKQNGLGDRPVYRGRFGILLDTFHDFTRFAGVGTGDLSVYFFYK